MFRDRIHAGRVLGRLVATSVTDHPLIVLALPRGGVPVGFEVAQAVHAAVFDIFLVRKLGVPGEEELAFGAIASGGVRVLNRSVITESGIQPDTVEQVTAQERIELDRRERLYREGLGPLDLRDRTAVLVDDGLATGATMLAAVQAVKLQVPKAVIVAVPVASRGARKDLLRVANQVICAEVPHRFASVGNWYRDFEQVTDDQVRDLLQYTA